MLYHMFTYIIFIFGIYYVVFVSMLYNASSIYELKLTNALKDSITQS